jgi:hypothetical protein
VALFVRKVKTASGATVVQISSMKRGKQTILEHRGSAHDEIELAALIAAARAKVTAGQVAFDLDAVNPSGAARVTVEPVVTGSRSRVLWDVLSSACRRLGLDAVDDRTFECLVLARVIESTSRADTVRAFAELGVSDAPPLRSISGSLAKSVDADWRGKVATAAYARAAWNGPLTLVLFDVTTLYFEAEYEDTFRKVGMSTERRVDPQITAGLLVDAGGFPLEIHAFEGNRGETTTLIPVLAAFRARHQVNDVRGRRRRRDALRRQPRRARGRGTFVHRQSAGLEGALRPCRSAGEPGQLLRRRADDRGDQADGDREAARDRRVVWQYSAARERRDNRTLNLQIGRAQAVADGKRPIKKDCESGS